MVFFTYKNNNYKLNGFFFAYKNNNYKLNGFFCLQKYKLYIKWVVLFTTIIIMN